MDIPPDVLEVLKCSSCEMYLSRGPVYLQHDGAASCCRCYTLKRQSTKCYICDESVSPGSLSAHYVSVHQDITHRSGSTWRATQGDGAWQRCLVSGVAGTAMCRYWLCHFLFLLFVRNPLSSKQLSEFRCEVRVTDPVTGHTRTFLPDPEYDKMFDWSILMNKTDFPAWHTEFNVCVEIIKTESS